MGFVLNKNCTEYERYNFVIEHSGLSYQEDDNYMYFLEPWETGKSGKITGSKDDEEYKNKIKKAENDKKRLEILSQIEELDKKSIRALREDGQYSEKQTWLEYYTEQITKLRAELPQE